MRFTTSPAPRRPRQEDEALIEDFLFKYEVCGRETDHPIKMALWIGCNITEAFDLRLSELREDFADAGPVVPVSRNETDGKRRQGLASRLGVGYDSA